MTNETQRPRLLVVEDKAHHIADARNVLEERVAGGYIGRVDYTSTYDGAQALLDANKYDAIMSDVFFPRSNSGLEEQFGTKIADHTIKKGLPFVLVTDTNHHGTKTQPVCDYIRARNMELIDNQGVKVDSYDCDAHSKQKNWKSAYMVLTYLLQRFTNKSAKFSDEKLVELDAIGNVSDANALKIRNVYSGIANNLDYHIGKGTVGEKLEFLHKYYPYFKESFDNYCTGLFDAELAGELK